MTDTFIQERDVNEYIPGIATACWVPSDKVQEGDRIWLLIGGQVMGLAKAGTDDANGWRSVWWFSNGAKLPLCMCAYMPVHVCPSTSDGSQDCMNRLGAKWEYETPTDAMRQFSLNIQKFEEDKLEGRETGKWYWGPERVVVPVVYPGPPDEECDIIFESGLARLSRFLDAGVFTKLLESQTDIC
jgi:hypothetical protein